jgi:hypothetical protein
MYRDPFRNQKRRLGVLYLILTDLLLLLAISVMFSDFRDPLFGANMWLGLHLGGLIVIVFVRAFQLMGW